jgi:prepilin-type processing-associated H-X9-DG protein
MDLFPENSKVRKVPEMTHCNRPSCSWRDVIVVSLVVIVLLALVPSCMIRGRGGERRAVCMNNQMQVGTALLIYEAAKARFPGYANRLQGAGASEPLVTSWVVPLLPHLEQHALFEAWREGDQPTVFMDVLVCPSDPPKQTSANTPSLSYVVNCGQPGDADTPAHGVFHNHNVDSDPVRVSVDDISAHDGTPYTLMLSENIQAGLWTDTDEASVGMVWHDRPGPGNRINEEKDAGDRPQDLQYARPSSNHAGGVVVMFCDGHVSFLGEEIDYQVYQHLMTPYGKRAGVPGEFDPTAL